LSRSLSHEVGILTLGRIAAYAVMFFVPLVNVRALSVEEYGYYRQFFLIFETLSPILIFGYPRSLLYHLPRADSREEKSAYITQTVVFLSAASLISMGIYAVMAAHMGEGLGAAARSFYWRLSAFTLFMVVSDYMEVLFIAQRQAVAQSIYHAVTSSLQAVVVIVASYHSRDVSTVIWALAFFSLARFVFAIVYTHSRHRLSFRHVSLRSIRDQASFALPVGLTGIALLLVSQTDKFIINRYMGREAFAIYTVGAFQVPFANIVRTSIGNITLPLMAQFQKSRDYGAMASLWQRSLMKTVVVFFPAFVFLEVTARPFITIMFTEQYADATPVFMLYMLLFLRSSVDAGAIIQAFNRTMFLFFGFVVALVVNVALGILLFKSIGRLGVPIATTITMTAMTIVNVWYSGKLIGVPFSSLLPMDELGKRFLAAAVPGVILWFVYQKHPVTTIYELAAAGLVYTVLYGAICFSTRIVTVDDLKSLMGRRPT
jgi:O-antigen/teichoic acid export membrane protein